MKTILSGERAVKFLRALIFLLALFLPTLALAASDTNASLVDMPAITGSNEAETGNGLGIQEQVPGDEPQAELPANIVFSAGMTTTIRDEDNFDLLAGISALDEKGNSLSVYITDRGGFDITRTGVYRVTYAAVHPQTLQEYSFTRAVAVFDPQPTTLSEVQQWIDAGNDAYAEGMAQGGDMAALSALMGAKPHWQYAVNAALFPTGYAGAYVSISEDADFAELGLDFGLDYYTWNVGINLLSDNIGEYFSAILTAPTSFQTFDIPSGAPVQPLAIDVAIRTFTETEISDGQILLPKNPVAPDTNTYFTYASCWLPDGYDKIVAGIDDVSDPDYVIIMLKETVPQNTEVSLKLYYAMDTGFKSAVVPGTVMWSPVTATLRMDGAADVSVTAAQAVTTSATDGRSVSISRFNPTDDYIIPGSTTSIRIRANNYNYYQTDFDYDSFTPVVHLYFPAGTTVTSASGFTKNTALSDAETDCYERAMSSRASWTNQDYAGQIGTDFLQLDPTFVFPVQYPNGNPIEAGDPLPVTLEFVFKLKGSEETFTKSTTTTYKMSEDVAWKFVSSTSHSTGDYPVSVCNITNGALGNREVSVGGWGSYSHSGSAKNTGSGIAKGVSLTLLQASTTSAKLNFGSLTVRSVRESTDAEWNSYTYEFIIVNANSGAERTVSGSLPVLTTSSTALSGTQTISLPALSEGEYIKEVTVWPGTEDAKGDLQPRTGFSLIYRHKAWDNQKWPDGSTVPNGGTAVAMSLRWDYYYENNPADLKTPSGGTYSLYYVTDPVCPIAQFVNTDTSGQYKTPGDTVIYNIYLYNHSLSAGVNWEDPVIAFKAPQYLRLDASSIDFAYEEIQIGDAYYYILHPGGTIGIGTGILKTIEIRFTVQSGALPGSYEVEHVWLSSDKRNTYVYSSSVISNVTNGYNYAPSGETAFRDLLINRLTWNFICQRPSNLAARSLYHTGYQVNQYIGVDGAAAVWTNTTGGYIPETLAPTAKNEDAKVRMTLKNTGNIALKNLRLYNILPYDVAGAKFTGVTEALGWTAYYYMGTDAPQPLSSVATINYTGTGWSLTAPADLNSVKAVMLVYSGDLGAGSSASAVLNFQVTEDNTTVHNQYSYSYTVGTDTAARLAYSGMHGFSTEVWVLSYDSNAGTETVTNMPDTQTGDINAANPTATVSSAVPARAGYTFQGWNSLANGQGTSYSDGNTISLSAAGLKSLTLYAMWTPLPDYKVIYDGNGHDSSSPPEEQTVSWNANAASAYRVFVRNLPNGFGKTDFSFKEWNTQADHSGTAYQPNDPIVANSGDVRLFAIWGATLSYNANGGTSFPSVESDTMAYYAGQACNITSGTPSKTGFTFLGWSTDMSAVTPEYTANGANGTQSSITLNQNTTLYAVWRINVYTVSFESNGGSTVDALENATYDTSIGAPAAPSRAGYSFAGWYKDNGNFTQAWTFGEGGDRVTSAITLYANWRLREDYEVIFHSNGGSAVAPRTGLKYGDLLAEPGEPTRKGYIFSGWYQDENLTEHWGFSTDTIALDTTHLYAKWTPGSYKVTFEPNNGEDSWEITDAPGDITIGKPADPVQADQSFTGWYTGDGTLWNFESDKVVEDITLYGGWASTNKTSLRVSFDAQGGTVEPSFKDVIYNMEYGVLPTPSRDGYIFLGWYTQQAGGLLIISTSIVNQTGEHTLYAHWERIPLPTSLPVLPVEPVPSVPVTGGSEKAGLIPLLFIAAASALLIGRKKTRA